MTFIDLFSTKKLKYEIEEKSSYISKLEHDIEEKSSYISKLEHDIEEKSSYISKLEFDIEEKSHTIEDVRNQYQNELEVKTAQLTCEKDKLDIQYGRLKLIYTFKNIILENLNNDVKTITEEHKKVKSMLTDEYGIAINIESKIKKMITEKSNLEFSITQKNNELNKLSGRAQNLIDEILYFEDEILYQSFSLYTPIYNFTSSEEYKDKLDEIRADQKRMIKNKTAVTCDADWTVNGSRVEGRKMTNDNIKQILRSFNVECENVIDRVKFSNYDVMKNRITKTFDTLNKLNESNQISIDEDYLELKYGELNLAHEYQIKKQEEKEEIRMLREQQREDLKLAKEIEERRKEIEKERQHYENAVKRLNQQISGENNEDKIQYLLDKRNEVEKYLSDLQEALKDIDYREANQRAGYVYIISNIGAFGENVYKIGMTRRLDPQDRIDELGNASVPFKFDVHAMIFSHDAPKLENNLHRAFEELKINMVNNRKEFFKVSIEEIEKVVKNNHDKSVEFIKLSEAQHYRETLKMKEKMQKSTS